MKTGKFWLAVLAGGVVANIFDFLLHGMILQNAYYGAMPELFNQEANPAWFIFGEFVAVFVFVWVYDKVYGSFGGGLKGGLMYGLYAAVLVNFPTWLFMSVFIKGFPYVLAWIWILSGIGWGVVLGAVVGAMYKKGEAAPAV